MVITSVITKCMYTIIITLYGDVYIELGRVSFVLWECRFMREQYYIFLNSTLHIPVCEPSFLGGGTAFSVDLKYIFVVSLTFQMILKCLLMFMCSKIKYDWGHCTM